VWRINHHPTILFFYTKSAPIVNHQSPSGIFLSQQINTSHQLPTKQAERSRKWAPTPNTLAHHTTTISCVENIILN
jgi:hypothetical protein